MNFSFSTNFDSKVSSINASSNVVNYVYNNSDIPELDYTIQPQDDFLSLLQNYMFNNTVGWSVVAYTAAKTLISEMFTSGLKENGWGNTGTTMVNSFYAGSIKVICDMLAGKLNSPEDVLATFASGGMGNEVLKGFTSKGFWKFKGTDAIFGDKAMVNTALKILERSNSSALVSPNAVKNLTLPYWKNNFDTANVQLGKDGNKLATAYFNATMSQLSAKMASAAGVDWIASMVTSVVSACIKDKVNSVGDFFAATKAGSNLLLSAYKTVYGYAFEQIFTFAGPAGKKFGKTLGTVVGNSFGSFFVDVFDENEVWCGAAGVATIAGGVGGIIGASILVSTVLTVSVPVAGWIVGAGIILCATAATAIVAWLYSVFG